MQPQNSFTAIKILHIALLTGLALMTGVMFLLIGGKLIEEKLVADQTVEIALQAVAALISIGCLLAGFSIFKKRLVEIRNSNQSAEARFAMYRGACVLWWAMLEGPGLFAIICYFLTSNTVFLILALFHLGVLAVFTPRKDNIVLLLNLTTEDVQKLEGSTV